MVDNEIKKYIEESIMNQYDENDIGGHGREHIEVVIARSFELNEKFGLNLNPNIMYVVAAYHDLGYKIDADNHEEVSSRLFLEDEQIKAFFTPEEIKIIAEAIVDHRASLEYEPRSIYGKLVSSADREVSIERYFKRSILYQAGKHKDENPTIGDVINYSYVKISSKYGKDGYANMYFPDDIYKKYLRDIQMFIEDKSSFVKKELEIMRDELGIDISNVSNKFWTDYGKKLILD